MGTYCYTLRSKTTPFLIDGQFQHVHHLCYAYKLSLFGFDEQSSFRIRNFHRHAQNAFDNRKSQFVVLCDKGVEEGDVVYRNFPSAEWFDDRSLNAEPIGFARRAGRVWTLKTETDFNYESKGSILDSATGLWLGNVARSRIHKNPESGLNEVRTLEGDRQYFNHETKTIISKEEAINLAIKKKQIEQGNLTA